MPWALPEKDSERLALAKAYPFPAPAEPYLFADGAVRPFDGGLDLNGRTPVIGHGSNRSPEQLARKFGRGVVIPVSYAWIEDHDIVYSAHVTQYGSIASTLIVATGCRVRVAITWLDAAQLERMHETEGVNYSYGRLEGVGLRLDGGPAALEGAFLYHSNHGALDHEGAPAGLAAVHAEGRSHPALSQEEMQDFICRRHRPGEALDAFILANVSDAERRRVLVREMRARAIPNELPRFKPLRVLDHIDADATTRPQD